MYLAVVTEQPKGNVHSGKHEQPSEPQPAAHGRLSRSKPGSRHGLDGADYKLKRKHLPQRCAEEGLPAGAQAPVQGDGFRLHRQNSVSR